MKLTKYLSKLTLGKLVEFIGADVISGLQRYDMANNQNEIAEIVRDLKGNEVFRAPGLLKSLVWSFSDGDLYEINLLLDGKTIDNYEEFRDELLSKKWGENTFSKSILGFFDIDDISYIRKQEDVIIDNEIIVPRLSASKEYFNEYEIFTPEMYPLHPYQKATKDKILKDLLEPSARFILHMPTGAGKTKTAVESMVDFWRVKGERKGFMVWFAHSKELCEQAYDTFRNTWAAKGDYPLQMFKIFDNNTPDLRDIENGILFIGFQKFNGLVKNNDPIALQIKNTTRLIVVDEAHKTIAQTYLNAVEYLLTPDTRLMGLTATPGRTGKAGDTQNAQLSAFYHNNKITVLNEWGAELSEPIAYLQDQKYLAKIKRIEITTNIKVPNLKKGQDLKRLSSDPTLNGAKLSDLSANDIRNSKILTEIEKAVVGRQHPTLVFSTDVAHAIILKILLNRKNITAECVLGNTPANLREKYIKLFKSGDLPVLINYGVLTTGFDAPNIRTLVISRPTTSIVLYSQMLGRALRGPKMGGYAEENILVDIVDNYTEFGTERAAFNFFDDFYV